MIKMPRLKKEVCNTTDFFQNKIHRLPVVDPTNGNVLYILNQKPLLRYVSLIQMFIFKGNV